MHIVADLKMKFRNTIHFSRYMAAASSESIVSAEFTKHILNRDIVSACDGAESTILLEGGATKSHILQVMI